MKNPYDLSGKVAIVTGGGRGLGAARERVDPRQQLTHSERLGQVVVGARGKADHLVVLGSARRQHQDRQLRPDLAKPAADLEAVEAGQHQVEQHQVERIAGRTVEAGRAVGHRLGFVSGRGQQVYQTLAQRLLVFHDQDPHRQPGQGYRMSPTNAVTKL